VWVQVPPSAPRLLRGLNGPGAHGGSPALSVTRQRALFEPAERSALPGLLRAAWFICAFAETFAAAVCR
jgi:hypothetical protein